MHILGGDKGIVLTTITFYIYIVTVYGTYKTSSSDFLQMPQVTILLLNFLETIFPVMALY